MIHSISFVYFEALLTQTPHSVFIKQGTHCTPSGGNGIRWCFSIKYKKKMEISYLRLDFHLMCPLEEVQTQGGGGASHVRHLICYRCSYSGSTELQVNTGTRPCNGMTISLCISLNVLHLALQCTSLVPYPVVYLLYSNYGQPC